MQKILGEWGTWISGPDGVLILARPEVVGNYSEYVMKC